MFAVPGGRLCALGTLSYTAPQERELQEVLQRQPRLQGGCPTHLIHVPLHLRGLVLGLPKASVPLWAEYPEYGLHAGKRQLFFPLAPSANS